MLADRSLPHQIILRLDAGAVMVSCNCRFDGDGWRPLGSASRWEPGEPAALWRAHMAAVEEREAPR